MDVLKQIVVVKMKLILPLLMLITAAFVLASAPSPTSAATAVPDSSPAQLVLRTSNKVRDSIMRGNLLCNHRLQMRYHSLK